MDLRLKRAAAFLVMAASAAPVAAQQQAAPPTTGGSALETLGGMRQTGGVAEWPASGRNPAWADLPWNSASTR